MDQLSEMKDETTKPYPDTQHKPSGWFWLGAFLGIATLGVWIFGWIAQAGNTQLDLRTNQQRTAAPDLFDDSTLSISSERICSKALEEINKLPSAVTMGSPLERSTVVTKATNSYSQMLNDLALLPTSTERDQLIFSGWLADWQTHMEDRQRFTSKLAAGEDPQFVMSAKANERIDKAITRIASTNQMLSCRFPSDVG